MRDGSEYRCLVHLPPQSSKVAEECSIAELSDHHPGGERDKEMEAFSEALQRIMQLSPTCSPLGGAGSMHLPAPMVKGSSV